MALLAAGFPAPPPAPTAAAATPQAERPTLTPADYGKWEQPGFATAISPDGVWLAVPISRVDGTGELRLHSTRETTESRSPHGPSAESGASPEAATDGPIVVAEGDGPVFSSNSAWLALSIGRSEEETERLREQDTPVRDDLGLLDLQRAASGADVEPEVVEGVRRFEFDDSGRWIALHRYPTEGSETRSADLVVRHLSTGADMVFGNVSDFAWQDEGSLLALTIAAADQAGNGVQLHDPESGRVAVLASGEADFSGLSWREESDDLAALRSREGDDLEDPDHLVLVWRGLSGAGSRPAPRVYDSREADGFPAGMRIVEHRVPSWSDDGGTVFFGVREATPRPEEEDAAARSPEEDAAGDPGDEGETRPDPDDPDEPDADDAEEAPLEEADVEIWHSRDERIVPMQELQLQRDRERSYLVAWHLDDDRLVRLGTDLMESVTLLEDQRHAVETDRTPYRFANMFDRERNDIWLVDVDTGERSLVAEGIWYFHGGSATGDRLLWFDDDQYWSHEISSGRTTSLTADLDAVFVNEDHDTPVREQRPPWGEAGWVEDDAAVLLYDRWDVWAVAPDGSGGARLTDGADEQVRHRVTRIDAGPFSLFGGSGGEPVDPDEPLWLSLYGEWTKRSGYARIDRPLARIAATGEDDGSDGNERGAAADPPERTGGRDRTSGPGPTEDGEVRRLAWADASLSGLRQAEDADVYAWTEERFDDSPDWFVGGPDLADGRQVTRTNPFHDDYAWGRSELVDYESATGQRLQGALYYPADYDPSRSYPMIVYVYERLSQGLHSYDAPSERSPYDTTVFTQEDYFVLRPDIVFRGRDPGVSAVECVVPAVEKVLDTRNVDPARVGLVGHSWGGYEASYIPSRTDLFAAAVAGAPLTNFFSMFGTIHWNQGMPESSHFETGQARMEVPYWEDMDAYVRNSPVMFVDELETPMLVFFGDEDGTVDWHQGVELYNYARRAGKHLVMLVYPGENHSARRKPNQIDYHRRVLTWFGHYLKGEDAPAWVTEGVSVLERERQERR